MSMFPLHPDELTADELADIEDMLRKAEIYFDKLTEWEDEFLDTIRSRIEQYGERTHLSAKQMEIVERIQHKLSGL